MFIISGNIVVDLDDITLIYPFKKNDTEFSFITKTAGKLTIRQSDLSKDKTLLASWYHLVMAVTGIEFNWNAREEGMSSITEENIDILSKFDPFNNPANAKIQEKYTRGF